MTLAAGVRAAFAVLVCLAAPCSVSAEGPAAGPPEAMAVRLTEPPVVDGAVLGEAVWATVPPVEGFWQTTPREGAPASERTEVRIAYTEDTLYFGVVCHDREPGRIIVSESRRDAPLDETDSFQILLDTYHDRQNGFVFGTNPAGIEYDGQVVNEGRGGEGSGGGQQSGAGGGFNVNWDGAWTVRAQTGEFGWSAEFAIPLRTLRYPRGGVQEWGLNFQRNIRRHKERSFWAPIGRQFDLLRVSSAGVLRGLELQSQRNLKLMPFVLAEARREYRPERRDEDGEVGLDLKYGVTPSLTLDATVNTDFAQVEVDEQQINLDRFTLFFPEKRPFFLENAGFFTAGQAGEVELFFSRRIGIHPTGQVVPILAGGRLSGKAGAFNLGLLNMQTRSVEGLTPGNNFTVARMSRDLPNRSGVGALFVNRQATGRLAADRDHNRTFALDGRWGIGRYGELAGFAARTSTPGITRDDHAYHLSLSRNSPGWETFAKYTEVGEGFNPEVGFLARRAYRKADALVFRSYRPRDLLGLHEMRPHVSYRGFWKPDGFYESGFVHLDSHWEFRNAYEVHTGVNFIEEGVRAAFEIVPGVFVPAGRYRHREFQLVAITNQGAPVSFDGTFRFGGFFGGDRAQLTPSVRARIGQAFLTEVLWARNDVDLPAGAFVTNLVRTRVSYSFTPRLFVQALLQYNDVFDNWSTNLRVGWLHAANTGLFVVYNENRETETGAFVRDRSLTVKFSRLIDVLD